MLKTTSLHALKMAPKSVPALSGSQAHLVEELSLLLYITHILFLLCGLLNLLQLILLFILLILCDLLHQLLLLPKYLIPLDFNSVEIGELGQP
jgi:sterol desaturase/sphingolipid hydroxylase (fatty acid hydroxylase superfamily)